MQEFLRTRLVNKDEWEIGHKKFGSVYFIRDENADCIKIGHSHNPWTRLRILQTGSANRLILIGIIAAPFEVEGIIHEQLQEGRTQGEWFWDRGVTTEWLMAMTKGEPICRNVWEIVNLPRNPDYEERELNLLQ